MKRLALVLCVLLLAAVAFVLLPAEMASTLRVPGKVVPRFEWSLVHSERGQLVSVQRDNLRDVVEFFESVDFGGGDKVSFELHAGLRAGVGVGDTIGSYHSAELERQWMRLRGQLDGEVAALAMYEAGEKAADIEEAQLLLDYRQTQFEWQEREMVRLRSLREQGLLTPADFEAAENELALRQVRVGIARANLQSIATGAKAQEINWRQVRVRALRDELDLLQQRLDGTSILSPLAGLLSASSLRDTLVVVRDTTSYIALMPIRWRDRAYWAVGQEVAFEVDGRDGSLRGRIAEIGRQIQMVNGEQFLPVKAQIESAGAALVPGALVQCVVGTAAVGPWEFIRHAFAQ